MGTLNELPQPDTITIGPAEIEHRFSVDALDARAFVSCISPFVTAQVRDRRRPFAYILSTYFDTDDLRFFHSSGRLSRARVRVRQYAAAESDQHSALLSEVCALEVKMSAFETRRIARIVDGPERIERILQHGTWCDKGDPTRARALRRTARAIATGQLSPVISTYFRRTTYTAHNIRVTIDDQIVFARPMAIGRPGQPAEPIEVISHSPMNTLEVKLSTSAPRWLEDAMRVLGRRQEDSKFVAGMRTARRLEVLAMSAKSRPPRRRLARSLSSFDREPTYV